MPSAFPHLRSTTRHLLLACLLLIVSRQVARGVEPTDKKASQAKKSSAAAPATPAKSKAAKSSAAKSTPAKLPGAVSLPPPPKADSTEPAAASLKIGPLQLVANADCAVYLHTPLANRRGRASGPRFALVETPDPAGTRWLVALGKSPPAAADDSPNASADPTGAVAQFQRQGDQLAFRWLPPAAAAPDAGLLANAVLEISTPQGRSFVALRKPASGEPLTLTLDSPMTAKWELPAPPDASLIKLELSLASREPRYRFVGSSTIDAAKGSTWIEFMDRRSAEALKLKVECELRRETLHLQAVPYFQMPGEAQVVKYTSAGYKRAVERVQAAVQQLEAQLASLPPAGGKQKGKGKSNAPPQLVAARAALEKQLEAARAARTQLDDLQTIKEAIEGKQKLLVRATVDAEGQSIELLRAGAARAGKK